MAGTCVTTTPGTGSTTTQHPACPGGWSRVRAQLRRRPGPAATDRSASVSACAGDGRDVIGVLAGRPDAERVRAVLVELHPGIAERARETAAAAGLSGVDGADRRTPGRPTRTPERVPADIVLLVGIFGNISDDDLWRTDRRQPRSCARPARP